MPRPASSREQDGRAVPTPRRRSQSTADAALSRRDGVTYRYVLRLSHAEHAATILRVLQQYSIRLGYLLLVPAVESDEHDAYLGLASEVDFDLPVRLASKGIRIRSGEEVKARR